MSVTISSGLAQHISGRATSLAWVWHIVRTDAVEFSFTAHDEDITEDGITYAARYGFDPSAVSHSGSLAVGNAELSAVFGGVSVTEADLRAGVWDHAAVRMRLLDWTTPTDGPLRVLRGWLGEVQHDGFQFKAELRGLADLYNRARAVVITPTCDAEFGDARCKVNAASYTTTGTVTGATSQREFATDLTPLENEYTGSAIRWTSGLNAGRKMEVKGNSAAGVFLLQIPMVSSIQLGDEFDAVLPCDKSRDTCRDVFANTVNFRGINEVPGTDKIVQVGGA